MFRRKLSGGFALAVLLTVSRGATAIGIADFIDYSLRDARGQVVMPGRLYVPPASQIPNAAPRPLIINLHGSGGNGADNMNQLYFLSDEMLRQAEERGAFIYAPQATSTWSSATITSEVMTMVDRAISTLNADTRRVYLLGYSQGSHGTWTMLSRYDGRFAAAIPISGGTVQSDFVPSRLIDTPIFAFHARDDATAPVSAMRAVINSILAADNQSLPIYLPPRDPRDGMISNPSFPIHQALSDAAHQYATVFDYFIADPRMDFLYYERATGGHTGMLDALSAPQVYDWLFSHTTAVPEPGAAVTALIAMSVAPCRRVRVPLFN
jgi:predicted esterase